MKVLQINTIVNSGSTGRIAEDLGVVAIQNGWNSYIGYGRGTRASASHKITIGHKLDFYLHALKTRLFDLHGFGSSRATNNFIKKIEKINPDIIHLHNIHGYYLHIEHLFSYLKRSNKPIVWTLHDCWPFTGHCAFYSFANCDKWKTQCQNCPSTQRYPNSWAYDNSFSNYNSKKIIFNGLNHLTIVTPSKWLADEVGKSFLKDYPVALIHNGIDLDTFAPTHNLDIINKYKISSLNYVIGVASIWDARKGLQDFIRLRAILDTSLWIVLVGLTAEQISSLPHGIIGIPRTENTHELAALYSAALAFVNPTYSDNFPSTNIEALACGTPIITYDTGGSPEAIDEETGFVVKKGDIEALKDRIIHICQSGSTHWSTKCRNRAVQYFNRTDRYMDYLDLYNKLLDNAQK